MINFISCTGKNYINKTSYNENYPSPLPRAPNLSPIESGGIERMLTPLKNDVDVSG